MKKKLPQTSVDAFHSLNPEKISAICQKIVNGLAVIGKGTYEDISKQIKTDPMKVWKRCSDLRNNGFLYRSGERRKMSSGREGFVWSLSDKGKKAVTVSSMPGKTVVDFSRALIQPKQSDYTQNLLF